MLTRQQLVLAIPCAQALLQYGTHPQKYANYSPNMDEGAAAQYEGSIGLTFILPLKRLFSFLSLLKQWCTTHTSRRTCALGITISTRTG
jgi:hypothetical protein